MSHRLTETPLASGSRMLSLVSDTDGEILTIRVMVDAEGRHTVQKAELETKAVVSPYIQTKP